MPNLLSARSSGYGGGGRGSGGDGGGNGNRACYGIAASAASLLLFCALAASVSVLIAFVFGGLALVAFAVAGCLAPPSWRLDPAGGGVSAESEAAAAQRAQRRFFGMPEAAVRALPTFPYAPKGAAEGGGDGGDLETGGSEACSVCLEDVKGGEMVRQLPACKHLFHAECIDMWLPDVPSVPMQPLAAAAESSWKSC